MALRYSADVEVRVSWDARKRSYHATVRDLTQPRLRWSGDIPTRFRLMGDGNWQSPGAYDRAAKIALQRASKWAYAQGKRFALERTPGGGYAAHRVFQAACPV